MSAVEQAHSQLTELLEAARKGMIIPIRLPAQLEELVSLLETAQEEQAQAAQAVAPSASAEEDSYFIGHAIHELRTPMTSIRGYVDMLGAMGELNDMQKQFLDVVKVNAKRMESLLTDVSIMNKLRKGTLKVAPKMDMFKNIAMKVEKDMTNVVNDLKRQLILEIPQGLPLLNIDGDHLSVALCKLVENGLRYSSAETGKVTLRGRADGNVLVIDVEDNGIGISPEDQAKLGTPYFRSDNDVVREFKGSGLGIPIAYGLISAINGSIELDTEVGRGTRFTIRIKGMS
jgi:signal transduction histidine kinase